MYSTCQIESLKWTRKAINEAAYAPWLADESKCRDGTANERF